MGHRLVIRFVAHWWTQWHRGRIHSRNMLDPEVFSPWARDQGRSGWQSNNSRKSWSSSSLDVSRCHQRLPGSPWHVLVRALLHCYTLSGYIPICRSPKIGEAHGPAMEFTQGCGWVSRRGKKWKKKNNQTTTCITPQWEETKKHRHWKYTISSVKSNLPTTVNHPFGGVYVSWGGTWISRLLTSKMKNVFCLVHFSHVPWSWKRCICMVYGQDSRDVGLAR